MTMNVTWEILLLVQTVTSGGGLHTFRRMLRATILGIQRSYVPATTPDMAGD
jgi:hypothetical protein